MIIIQQIKDRIKNNSYSFFKKKVRLYIYKKIYISRINKTMEDKRNQSYCTDAIKLMRIHAIYTINLAQKEEQVREAYGLALAKISAIPIR